MNRHSSAFCFIISENGWLVKTRMNEQHELHLGALSLETHPGVMGMSESRFSTLNWVVPRHCSSRQEA